MSNDHYKAMLQLFIKKVFDSKPSVYVLYIVQSLHVDFLAAL